MRWTKPGGRGEILVDEAAKEIPRPWLSVFPEAYGRRYLAVCWMCPTDGALLSKVCRDSAQVRGFVSAHRRCGYLLEPVPDPRAPPAVMDDWVDQQRAVG